MTKHAHLDPASKIITDLGGTGAVAAIAKVHRTRVSNWKRGGVIPFRHVPALIAAAHEKGVALSADDFLPPRSEGRAA